MFMKTLLSKGYRSSSMDSIRKALILMSLEIRMTFFSNSKQFMSCTMFLGVIKSSKCLKDIFGGQNT